MDFIYIAGVDAGVNFYVDEVSLSKIAPIVNPEDIDSDGMLIPGNRVVSEIWTVYLMKMRIMIVFLIY